MSTTPLAAAERYFHEAMARLPNLLADQRGQLDRAAELCTEAIAKIGPCRTNSLRTQQAGATVDMFILLHGWREFRAIGVVGPFVAVTWFANLAVPVAWLTTLMRLYMVAVTAGVVGLALSLAYLLGTRVAHSSIDAPQAIQIGVAYWVWVGSFAAVLAGALIGRLYEL